MRQHKATTSLANAEKTGPQLHAYRFIIMLLFIIWFLSGFYTLRLALLANLLCNDYTRTHPQFV